MIFLDIWLIYTLIYVILCGTVLYWFKKQGGDWPQMWFWMIGGVFPVMYIGLPFLLLKVICRPDLEYKWLKDHNLLPWQQKRKKRK